MHDDLIGYVLGLLETEEHMNIDRLVERDAAVSLHVEVLRRELVVFEVAREHHSPPEGLAVRTCQRLRNGDERR